MKCLGLIDQYFPFFFPPCLITINYCLRFHKLINTFLNNNKIELNRRYLISKVITRFCVLLLSSKAIGKFTLLLIINFTLVNSVKLITGSEYH